MQHRLTPRYARASRRTSDFGGDPSDFRESPTTALGLAACSGPAIRGPRCTLLVFVNDAPTQGAIVENKRLGAALPHIQLEQQNRADILERRRLTRRDRGRLQADMRAAWPQGPAQDLESQPPGQPAAEYRRPARR